MRRRWSLVLGLVAVAAATTAIRLPGFLSARHIDFDEGVYGVSVLAMRKGWLPFRDVFSSQGPLYLPTLWLFDVAGFRHFRAVRLGMVVVAVAMALGVYVVSRCTTDEGGTFASLVAATVVGTSAAGIAAAGPIHSDGLALMFGVWAVAVLFGAGPFHRKRPLIVGLLIGAAVAVKSLFVAPVVLAVTWWHIRRRGWSELAATAATAAAVCLAVSLPWGLGNVWDQFVAFQLDVERDRAWWSNLRDLASLIWERDIVFLLFVAVGLVVAAVRVAKQSWPPGDRAKQAVVVVWLVATLLLIVFGTEFNRGFYRFVVLLIAPAMVTFAILRPPARVTAGAVAGALLLMPLHLNGADIYMDNQLLTTVQAEVVAELEALPPAALVISDEPGLAWVAQRYPPPNLVDTSFARIQSGNLTAAEVVAGAAREDVCAALFFSGRFDTLDDSLGSQLAGYDLAKAWGDNVRLYVKADCRP